MIIDMKKENFILIGVIIVLIIIVAIIWGRRAPRPAEPEPLAAPEVTTPANPASAVGASPFGEMPTVNPTARTNPYRSIRTNPFE